MTGRKPTTSRFKRAFLVAAAALGIGGAAVALENLPKDPATDTQVASINVSPSDQMWKQTLPMKSDQAKAAELTTAAASGDSWRVKALLGSGVSPTSDAAYNGDYAMVQTLLERGADPRANNNLALTTAQENGYTGIEQLLQGAIDRLNSAPLFIGDDGEPIYPPGPITPWSPSPPPPGPDF